MARELKFQEMLDSLRDSLESRPEHRTGRNGQYEIAEAGLGAFLAFYLQSPSFLAHQRDRQRNKGRIALSVREQ